MKARVRVLAVSEQGYVRYLWSASVLGRVAYLFIAILAVSASVAWYTQGFNGSASLMSFGAVVALWVFYKLHIIAKATANTYNNPLWLEIDDEDNNQIGCSQYEHTNKTTIAFTQFTEKLSPILYIAVILFAFACFTSGAYYIH